MLTKTMVQPSSWVSTDVQLEKIQGEYLYQFSDRLQTRLLELQERQQTDRLTEDEKAELAGILDLNQILKFMNAQLVTANQLVDLNQFSGIIQIHQDPLVYQQEIRDEWPA